MQRTDGGARGSGLGTVRKVKGLRSELGGYRTVPGREHTQGAQAVTWQ